LAGSDDPWLQACALHRIGVLGLAELAGPVAAALDDRDALVRETAVEAGRNIAMAKPVQPNLGMPASHYHRPPLSWRSGELLPHMGGLTTA
ncbi:MAG TPA: hypothetical protein P5526_11220, partial [Anaerolineae bacterium]|nr:hypothetical protein [Anaerolineae bacterium]